MRVSAVRTAADGKGSLAMGSLAETADELKALAHEKIAEGHALLAKACRARSQLAAGIDPLIPLKVAADELDIRPRVLSDEERRGRIELGHAGRKRVVRRSELERWALSRRTTKTTDKTESPREAARRAVAERAKRST